MNITFVMGSNNVMITGCPEGVVSVVGRIEGPMRVSISLESLTLNITSTDMTTEFRGAVIVPPVLEFVVGPSGFVLQGDIAVAQGDIHQFGLIFFANHSSGDSAECQFTLNVTFTMAEEGGGGLMFTGCPQVPLSQQVGVNPQAPMIRIPLNGLSNLNISLANPMAMLHFKTDATSSVMLDSLNFTGNPAIGYFLELDTAEVAQLVRLQVNVTITVNDSMGGTSECRFAVDLRFVEGGSGPTIRGCPVDPLPPLMVEISGSEMLRVPLIGLNLNITSDAVRLHACPSQPFHGDRLP